MAADAVPQQAAPGPGRGPRISAELARLVLVVAVPLAALSAYLLRDFAQREAAQASDDVRAMAIITADRAGRFVEGARAALESIARRPLIRAADPKRCDPALPDLLQAYPHASNILVVDREARIVCGAVPPPRGREVRVAEPELLAEMLMDPRFRLSKPLLGRISGKWTLTAVQPVFADDGTVSGTVSMSVDLERWLSFDDVLGTRPRAIAAVVSGEGIVISRSSEAREWIGRSVAQTGLHAAALGSRQGTLRADGLKGVDRLWGYARVPGTNWYAVAGVPAKEVFDPVQVRVIAAAVLLVAVLAGAVALAASIAARLVKPLGAVSAALRDRSAGREGGRVPEGGVREVAELAREYNRAIDVAERMQADLRAGEARYRRLAEQSPDAMLIHSGHRIVLVNDALVRLLGAASASELIGRPATFMLPPEEAQTAVARIARLYEGHTVPLAEQVYLRMDGTPVEVEIAAAPISFDGRPAAQVTVRDVTGRRRADEALRRFRAALDISGDAVLLIDRATLRYVDVNRTFCDLVGYAREEVLGKTPMDIFSAQRAELERDYDALIADNAAPANRVDGWYTRRDGTRVPVETRRQALHTKDGWIIVATARDMTERRAAEARIARLNRVYAVLSGINAAIVRIRNRDELFREATRIAVDEGRLLFAWLGLVDYGAMQVRLAAWHGGKPGTAEAIRERMAVRLDLPEGAGVIASAVAGRRPVVSNDVPADPRIRLQDEMANIGARSMAVFPLLVDDEVAAVLALHAAEPGYFDADEMALLQELAGDIAFAMRHIGQAEKLDYLAYYDSLTGLANRTLFLERLTQSIHAAGQAGDKLGLIIADVERLRTVNESMGRGAGDALIKALAGRLARGADRSDLARISADHFAIILPGVKGRSSVTRRAQRMWTECFGQPFGIDGAELRVSGRAGIAVFPNDGQDAETLIRGAEAALRRAKETGERMVHHAAEMTERSAERLSLENRLRRALEREEFVLHYQPKVELDTRRLAGVEALIRWQSPEQGLVPPAQFIPLMEETGMILEAGDWALRQAVRDHKRWTALGLRAPRVAVNVSAVQLRKRDFLESLAGALREGASPPGIDLEITESLVMEDIQGNIEKLKEARRLGVTIAIDDFGTGYSSLSYLARLPVQALKIDRSFIITMLQEPDTMTLVSTVISLAHSLKLKVTAEGVDDEEQAKVLRLLRCDEIQGFLHSRPLPFDGLSRLLAEEAARERG